MKLLRLIGILCASFLLMNACKKSNSDSLFLLGNEDNYVSVDEVYPKEYREIWPSEPFGFDTTMMYDGFDTTMMYDGFFPPDITGKYFIDGIVSWGNEVNVFGDYSLEMDYSDPWIKNKMITITITNQRNSVASLDVEISTNSSSMKEHFDEVYINGDASTGSFVLYYNSSSSQGDGTAYHYGNIIKGVLVPANSNPSYPNGGIAKIEKWYVIKKVDCSIQGMPYCQEGGQRVYIDKKPNGGFAERIVE